LGKSGWVSARLAKGDEVPLPLLREWIDESYEAIAPKRLAGGKAKKAVKKPSKTR
jgi:predicted DNA-binding protein (MmcQ/YjbR family)